MTDSCPRYRGNKELRFSAEEKEEILKLFPEEAAPEAKRADYWTGSVGV